MRAHLLAVGEHMPAWVAQGFEEYRKRLSRELPLQLVEVKPAPRAKAGDAARAQRDEGAALLAALPRDAHVVILDGGGRAWSSEQLAERLAHWRMHAREPYFLIGGADGHADEVRVRADECWSLGPLTLPHMLVRVIVAEQLYRAASMLAGHPYHRG